MVLEKFKYLRINVFFVSLEDDSYFLIVIVHLLYLQIELFYLSLLCNLILRVFPVAFVNYGTYNC